MDGKILTVKANNDFLVKELVAVLPPSYENGMIIFGGKRVNDDGEQTLKERLITNEITLHVVASLNKN
ncbi:MAG: hypothetical protein JSR80_03865 [Verrucomicrobia bacterium]|nr:hypothetical protein [Verrucomicrobiota bacterium]